ncbi:uncharacterized protein LACBIDRAFT_323169 [Laccaria bicolor S238N-H82]|uniref:Predicted protein n=1 Tax=Laccaria bicolor (strain S238N-H82 / ATCC MYA-4686) TaxID=486041 RepID=B0CZC0_LACBS|nr:uncharacterized protein LACBIDRAFT_323169 [Laccaria bicolor S238N-H82]EDR12593.1 predicted protein [Laccaria bicolor S238N-H82]|eukprot:XP_001876857.1 predicted protein [Laccaria bicolor S238N-H82]
MSIREAPLLLGRVCSEWRSITLSTPRLWASLHIPAPAPHSLSEYFASILKIEKQCKGTEEWIRRSGQCPLSISLHTPSPHYRFNMAEMQPFVEVSKWILPSTKRWKNFSFKAPTDSSPHFQKIAEGDVPMLEALGITIVPRTIYISGLLSAPKLRKLSLTRFRDNLLSLPVHWSQLTHLTLDAEGSSKQFLGMPSPLTYREVSKVLKNCSLLSMSGTRLKPKSQAAPPQKGKVTTTRQNRPADTEVQERGKTRATGSVETDEYEHEIGDSDKGRSFLEGRLLMVPAGALLTLGALATTLFQIAAMPGVALPVVNAVCTVAFLLRDVELEVVAEDIRDIAIAQYNELTNDLKDFTEGLRVKVMEELEKKTEVLKEKTVELAEVVEKVAQQGHVDKDGLWSPNGCQSLSSCKGEHQAMTISNRPTQGIKPQQLRQSGSGGLALKLQNGGILVEMVTDDGAAWLASKANAEAFLQELGEKEASFKTRSFNVIAYYVPLNLDDNSEKDRGEIEEMNNIPKGTLTKLRWIKPPARRRPDQCFAHVIATFSDAESANRAIVNGLSICHKRVSVVKCKKEPIRCLKCQGWDHVALECVIAKEVNVCGTCGGDHWTRQTLTQAGTAAVRPSSGK